MFLQADSISSLTAVTALKGSWLSKYNVAIKYNKIWNISFVLFGNDDSYEE